MAAEVPHYEVFWNLNSHGLADFAEDSGLRTYPISPEIVYLYTGLDGPLSDPNCVGGNQGMSEHNLIPLWFSPQQREKLGPATRRTQNGRRLANLSRCSSDHAEPSSSCLRCFRCQGTSCIAKAIVEVQEGQRGRAIAPESSR